jgi:hypothetical protein
MRKQMGKLICRLILGVTLLIPAIADVRANDPQPQERIEVIGVRADERYGAGGGGGGRYRGPQQESNAAEPGGSLEGEELAANRFQPGCSREANLMKAVESAAHAGEPMDSIPKSWSQMVQMGVSLFEDIRDQLSGGVKDQDYQSPDWRKMKVIFEGFEYSSTANAQAGINGIYFIIEIHYWINQASKDVQQLKLKNTKEQGCAGQITSVT